jgi:hypothetical protein
MRFREALKFSLELILPEKAILAVEHLTLEHSGEGKSTLPEPTVIEAVPSKNARNLIEELDSSQFGGPSFGPQTIALMSLALEEALAMLPRPADDGCARAIAAHVLKVAAEGERNPVRLRTAAMSVFELDGT